MEPMHETHAPGSTELDNSHYVTEGLVYRQSSGAAFAPCGTERVRVRLAAPAEVLSGQALVGRAVLFRWPTDSEGWVRGSRRDRGTPQ